MYKDVDILCTCGYAKAFAAPAGTVSGTRRRVTSSLDDLLSEEHLAVRIDQEAPAVVGKAAYDAVYDHYTITDTFIIKFKD